MKTWFEINNRLLEIERMEVKTEEVKREWDELLDRKVGGTLKRERYYEVPEGKKEGKGRTKKKGQGKDVGIISGDMEGKTSLLGAVLDQIGTGATELVLSPHTTEAFL